MRIACVLIPRFGLALELLAQPALRGRPVILGGAPEERKVVVECSPQAERAGVRRGMPLREALVRCRDAVFLEAHPGLYAGVFEQMLDALERVSPVVEGSPPGCAFVDLAGLAGAGTTAGETALADALGVAAKEAAGLTPRVGVADTRFAAWAAALSASREQQPHRGASAPRVPVRVVAPGEATAFLAPLPVERLPVSDELRRQVRWLGLRTVGELAALPRAALAARFGPEGVMLWDLARGEGGDPLAPRHRPPEISARIEFSQPVVESSVILTAARHLLKRVFRRPECAGRAARGIALDAALSNGHRWQRAITFREPVTEREQMLRALATKLGDATFPAPAESLELRLRELCGEAGVQGRLFAGHAGSAHALDAAIDQLRARFGRTPIMKIVGVEPWSRLPERQYALIDYEPSTSLSRSA